MKLVDHFQYGLNSPICLTWELTYACNLACVHCLSSSGRRDPRELTTAEAKGVVDELQKMQVFYVNIGGGEPTVRPDFWELLDYAIDHQVGVKFSTNGDQAGRRASRAAGPHRLRRRADLPRRGHRRGERRGPRARARTTWRCGRWRTWPRRGSSSRRSRVVMTRQNVDQLDEFDAIADKFGAQLRITRLRPSGRGADVWDELHPTAAQQRQMYDWLVARGDNVLTGDSFFHLSAYGEALPGLNLCGAGRVVCLIDPVGDVYACPFAIHENFLAGQRPLAGRVRGGLAVVGAVPVAARAADRRRVPVVRVLRLLPGRVHGGEVLHRAAAGRARPGVRARVRRAGVGRAVGGRRRSRVRTSTTPAAAARPRWRSRSACGRTRPARPARCVGASADARLGPASARA